MIFDPPLQIVPHNWKIQDTRNFTAVSATVFELIPERFDDFLGVIISSYPGVSSELRFVSFHCPKNAPRNLTRNCTTVNYNSKCTVLKYLPS